MDTVISVKNLSKRYRIGLTQKRADTFVGQLGQMLRAPIDNFRRLRSMSKFDREDESVFWALKDINFEVKRGEVLGIIGHNGAGKSTLLKILSRITEPTTGEIMIKGRIAALLEVGTGFHPELTGRENIYMNGTILGMTKKEIDSKLDEIVDFSGVEKYIDTPVKFYSSGMKVRLGFSVAAHLEPEILVIDEVLAVGDVEFQRKCLGKMESVSQSGRTVLFVSHNMGAVRSLCQRGLVLNHGKVQFMGDAEEATRNYTEKLTLQQFENQKSWSIKEAPGDDRVKILSLSVKPINGKVIEVKSGISVECICLNSSIENGVLAMGFEVQSAEGVTLIHHAGRVAKPTDLRIGTCYAVKVFIPPYILNKGAYQLKVFFGLNFVESLTPNPPILFFEVQNSGDIDEFVKEVPGMLRPRIKYESKVLPDRLIK